MSPTGTHALSVSRIPHGRTGTLAHMQLVERHLFLLTICRCHTRPPHTHFHLPASKTTPVWTRHQPQPLCANRWPGFLRAFPQGQGGRPGWRWICTPSWLTHLSHREWLARGDPEFTVSTGASQAMGVGHGAWPGGRVRVFAQWATSVQALLSSGQAHGPAWHSWGPETFQ